MPDSVIENVAPYHELCARILKHYGVKIMWLPQELREDHPVPEGKWHFHNKSGQLVFGIGNDPKSKNYWVVGNCGNSAGGKKTVCEKVVEELKKLGSKEHKLEPASTKACKAG
jgi:hypothetical protein